jgi:outer membrane protein TolC
MDTDAAAARVEISQLQETIEEYKRECATAKNNMATLKVSHDLQR